jgi:hypothetical protein
VTAPAAAGERGLAARWAACWPQALAAWSAYTLLRSPRFVASNREAKAEDMVGEIAAIRLRDQVIVVNEQVVRERGLEEHGLAILAHEVGHHVYVPGNLTDSARMVTAIARMLTGLPPFAARLVANLYGDLLINDRLQRRAGVDIAAVFRQLARRAGASSSTSAVWRVYTRAYEHLWRLAPGEIAPGDVDADTDADALLISRIIRAFAGDWLRGARRFAAVIYRYLAADEAAKRGQTFIGLGLHDTRGAGKAIPGEPDGAAIPDGLTDVDPSELEDDGDFDGDILDPLGENRPPPALDTAPTSEGQGQPGRQTRQPFEYAQVLRALGLDLADHEITMRYYRERALPHLIPFPRRRAPRATEPLAEGYESWEATDPVDALDLVGSVLRSPVMIPGVTTVQRVYGETPGADPAPVPVDLDIYVDCSGSMPNPGVDVSYLALAGVILAMSALRAGARVQATLWSGAGQFETSRGFVRDEATVLRIITGFLCGATAFPLHVLRDTYAARKPDDAPAHVVVISDDGADTMLARDEKGGDGAEICRRALAAARGGGTLVLNLGPKRPWKAAHALETCGFRIHRVRAWEDLVAFAAAFVRETYGETA